MRSGVLRVTQCRNTFISQHFSPGFARGGADGQGHKARDGGMPQAYLTARRGIRPSATQQTRPDPPPQQESFEKFGSETICADGDATGMTSEMRRMRGRRRSPPVIPCARPISPLDDAGRRARRGRFSTMPDGSRSTSRRQRDTRVRVPAHRRLNPAG